MAIIAGWWTAEIGRQPWVVWNVLKTSDAVSPLVSTAEAAASLAMFAGCCTRCSFVLFHQCLSAPHPPGAAGRGGCRRKLHVSSLPNTFREVFRVAARSARLRRLCFGNANGWGSAVSLGNLWFGIFVAVIAGYVILDGFDIGVGSLHLVVAKTDEERRRSLNSIGPVWDGNEVWIVLGVGVLFAAFPAVYASLFSGFYVVFMLVLLV